MSECVNQYFIFNNEIKSCAEFEKYNSSIGKSLYEVIRIHKGTPDFLIEHLERLENSANIMNYKLGITREEIISSIKELVKKNLVEEGNIKLVVNYHYIEEKFLAYFIPHSYPTKEQYENGVKTITYHGERNNPNAKVINMDFREKVNAEIKDKSVYEAILIDHQGYITEGSRSNIFMVQGDTVITSPVENVLPGITRQFIIKVCEKLNQKVEERKIHEQHIKDLDGLFISGTSPKVLPISSVDEFQFTSAQNPIIQAIMTKFDDELSENKKK